MKSFFVVKKAVRKKSPPRRIELHTLCTGHLLPTLCATVSHILLFKLENYFTKHSVHTEGYKHRVKDYLPFVQYIHYAGDYNIYISNADLRGI